MKLETRKAVAMIELIFAIVVIGIVMLSVPLLLTQVQKSTTVALQQESIAIAASHTNALLTYAWDEQNTDGLATSVNILNTQSTNLAQVDGTVHMSNTLTYPGSRLRRYSDINTTLAVDASTTLGHDGVSEDTDDIDDFQGTSFSLNLITGGSNISYKGEYIDTDITIANSVRYGDDAAGYANPSAIFAFSTPFRRASPGGTTNIKLISTTLTSNRTEEEFKNKNIVFNAFLCNVGSFRLEFQGNK